MPKGLMRSLNTNVTLFFWIPAGACARVGGYGNDKTEFPRKPEGSEACEARPTAKQSEAEGLAEPRRETRRGLGIGLWKPQVPGAGGEDRSRPSVAKAASGFVARAARQGARAGGAKIEGFFS